MKHPALENRKGEKRKMASIYDDPAVRMMRQRALQNFASGNPGRAAESYLRNCIAECQHHTMQAFRWLSGNSLRKGIHPAGSDTVHAFSDYRQPGRGKHRRFEALPGAGFPKRHYLREQDT